MTPLCRIAWFGHAGGARADGLTTYSREHVAALAALGIEIRFFAHRRDGSATSVADSVLLDSARFKTVTIPAPGSRRRIAAALDDFGPDLVHISLSFSLLDAWILTASRRRGIPTVVTVHLPYAPFHSSRGRVLRGLYRFHSGALLAAGQVIALSEDQAALLRSTGVAPERITVLPNSIDTTVFSPGPSAFRERLGARFVVAYAGRIDPEKRVPALVEAFRGQPWGDDHALVIAGAGAEERLVRAAAAADPRIHVLGLVCDRGELVDVLRAADVFVLPSTAEGLSLSLLEAMATGCAVIATDAGDDVAALGAAGLHLPIRPLQPALGQALARLHDDEALRMQLRAAARRRAVDAFSIRARIDDLLDVYDRVLSGATGMVSAQAARVG